jgi:hypothetical protein
MPWLVQENFVFIDGTEKNSAGIRFFDDKRANISNYLQGLGKSATLIRTGDVERRAG